MSPEMNFESSHTYEEMMQNESREEAKEPKVFKTKSLCVMEDVTKIQPIETVKEKDNGKNPSSVQKENKEDESHIVVSQRNVQEEHSYSILTQWEKELEMLENWLNHPKVEEYYQRNEIMKDRKGEPSRRRKSRRNKEEGEETNGQQQQEPATRRLSREQERVATKEPARGQDGQGDYLVERVDRKIIQRDKRRLQW